MRTPTLLFITQKIHENDDDLAFTILWIKQFIKEGFAVEVICLERRDFDGSFPVHSLGKETGKGKLARILRFLSLVTTLKYDRVFVHMNPEYFTVGGWWWMLRGVPCYFWYTHYTMSVHVFLAGLICRRLFAATAQSLPQYEGSPKKIVLGHGIDIDYWQQNAVLAASETSLVYINRLSRSKRVERAIKTLAFLPSQYTLTIYGRVVPGEEAYYDELVALAGEAPYAGRVFFKGSLPMHKLKDVYPLHRLMVNMASETIDKTMLECMLFGCYPVTTPGNSKAIGLPEYPQGEEPADLAAFILGGTWKQISPEALRAIVQERHSLAVLVQKMAAIIRPGT